MEDEDLAPGIDPVEDPTRRAAGIDVPRAVHGKGGDVGLGLPHRPSFGPPARDINAPNTFGTITSTVSTARTGELVLKIFF